MLEADLKVGSCDRCNTFTLDDKWSRDDFTTINGRVDCIGEGKKGFRAFSLNIFNSLVEITGSFWNLDVSIQTGKM